MTDTVSAINYIKSYRKLDEDLHKGAPKGSLAYHATEICLKYWDMAIQALEQTRWIPVSERLPEDEQEVLITYKISVKYHVWSAIWDELHGRFYDKEYRSYISLNYVTAWMPLPIPYKEKEE